MQYQVLRTIVFLGLSAALSVAFAQKTMSIPAPSVEIDSSATIIYCDAILQAVLQASEKDPKSTGSAVALTASIDTQQTDRLVIEISDRILYVHHREDFEKGALYYGQMSPLEIAKGSARQGIIAFGHDSRLKSTTISVLSLNRTTGVGLWTLSKDTLWAKESPQARDYPASTAIYLRCGARRQ